MKSWQTFYTIPHFAEITDLALKIRCQDQLLELPLDRRVDGRLQPASKQSLSAELRKRLHKSPLQPKPRVFCGISARGLSLRRLTIPAAAEEARHRLLQLQIESEFPLPPQDLAWGSTSLNGAASIPSGIHQEQLLVAAVRKQTLDDYIDLFTACGAVPIFVPAALARAALCPEVSGRIAHLEVGPRSSELLLLEDGTPIQLATLPWDTAVLADATSAESVTPLQSPQPSSQAGTPSHVPVAENQSRLQSAAASLGALFRSRPTLRRLYVSGLPPQHQSFLEILSNELGYPCELLLPDSTHIGSTAIAGLARAAEQNRAILRLNMGTEARKDGSDAAKPFPVKWAAAALVLVLLAASFPYLEALALKPRLARKLAALKADRGRLPAIDSELDFLRYFKQGQPPYLDALYMISRAVPPGSRFDSLSMTRRGELSFKGSVRDINQLADFRAKLLDSGLFSNIAVEEQSPTPDRQKLLIRVTAQWKADSVTREAAALAAAKEPERPKNAPATFGPGMMPAGFPGSSMPMGNASGPGATMALPSGAVRTRGSSLPAGAMQLPPGVTLPGSAVPPATAGGVAQPDIGSPVPSPTPPTPPPPTQP